MKPKKNHNPLCEILEHWNIFSNHLFINTENLKKDFFQSIPAEYKKRGAD